MADFVKAFNITVFDYEGIWSNDAGDAGGITVYGLTIMEDPDWSMWSLIRQLYAGSGDMAAKITAHPEILTSAHDYYKRTYWDKMLCDQVADQNIANELFDTGVNCSIGTAVTFLQRSLNLLNREQKDYPDITEDGSMGKNTLAALNANKNHDNLLLLMNVLQGERYVEICERNRTQERFLNGWLKRVQLNRTVV